MDPDATRYLAYADIRNVQLSGEKAVLLVSKYGLSQKCASRILNIKLGVVRRAMAAHAENRQVGRNGRPESLSEGEKAELTEHVEKMIESHESPTKRKVAAEVSTLFCLNSTLVNDSNLVLV
jgi:phosphomannomutase